MKYEENKLAWEVLTQTAAHFSEASINLDIPEFETMPEKEDWIKERCVDMACPVSENADKSQIQKLRRAGKIVESHLFYRLARHYYMLAHVNDSKNKELSRLFMTLHAFLGNAYYFPANKSTVQTLLVYAAAYPQKYPYYPGRAEDRMIESVRYLQELGISVSIEEGTVSCSDQMRQDLFVLLEGKIARTGGMPVLNWIFDTYLNSYIPILDRLLIGRSVDDKERNEPINLLLQLSVKHLTAKGEGASTKGKDERMAEIAQLAEALLDIYDIQGESGIEYASMDIERFPIYLQNEMIVDKFCVPQQYSGEFVLKSIEYLVKPWFSYAETEYHYRDFYKVAEYFLRPNRAGGFVNLYDLKQSTNLSWRRLGQILADMSMPVREVNREFTSLDGKVNFSSRPFIMFNKDRYLYVDRHLCGMGFYHGICELISKHHETLSRDQGKQVEAMLRDEMAQKGFRFAYGEYPTKNGHSGSDCDLVLLGERNVFFEIKKKDAADEMAQFDDVKLLETMAFGMMRAQKQCFYHEANLKANGAMILSDGQRIPYEADKFPTYKVSVCYPEYSFLCNKMFSMTMIESVLQGKFTAIDTTRQTQLDKLNILGGKIRECVMSVYRDKSMGVREVSFYSLFCSMQQVLTAVWICDSEQEFFDVLTEWIYTSDKTLDPYIALLIAKKNMQDPSNGVHKAMLDFAKKSGRPIVVVG